MVKLFLSLSLWTTTACMSVCMKHTMKHPNSSGFNYRMHNYVLWTFLINKLNQFRLRKIPPQITSNLFPKKVSCVPNLCTLIKLPNENNKGLPLGHPLGSSWRLSVWKKERKAKGFGSLMRFLLRKCKITEMVFATRTLLWDYHKYDPAWDTALSVTMSAL